MDFTTTEAAHDLGGLVDTIVDAVCTPEHQRELDGLEQRFDRELWGKLIDADILSSASAPRSSSRNGALQRSAARRSSPSPCTAKWVRGRFAPSVPVRATVLPAPVPRWASARSPTHSWFPPKPIPAQPFFWSPRMTRESR